MRPCAGCDAPAVGAWQARYGETVWAFCSEACAAAWVAGWIRATPGGEVALTVLGDDAPRAAQGPRLRVRAPDVVWDEWYTALCTALDAVGTLPPLGPPAHG